VLNFVHQIFNVNFEGMFSTVTNGKHWIVNEHVLNNYHDNVLTPNTFSSMANIITESVVMKEEPNSFPQLKAFCPGGKIFIYQPFSFF